MSDDYSIGYKKPPRHSQFRRGQSGNPSGRPRGARNLATDLAEELAERIFVRDGERRLKISKQRMVLKSVLQKAMKGDVRAAESIFRMMASIIESQSEEEAPTKLAPSEKAILGRFVERWLNKNDKPAT